MEYRLRRADGEYCWIVDSGVPRFDPAGGFLGYLDKAPGLAGRDVRRAAVYGSVMASFAIEDFGIGRFLTLDHGPVEGRFKQFRKLSTF